MITEKSTNERFAKLSEKLSQIQVDFPLFRITILKTPIKLINSSKKLKN